MPAYYDEKIIAGPFVFTIGRHSASYFVDVHNSATGEHIKTAGPYPTVTRCREIIQTAVERVNR